MNKKLILTLLIVLVIGIILIIFLSNIEELSPNETLIKYYKLINEYKLDDSTKLLNKELRDYTEKNGHRMKTIDTVTKKGKIKTTKIVENKTIDNTAIITIKLIYEDGSFLQLKHQLVKERSWKLSDTGDPLDSLKYMRQSKEV